MRLSVYLRKQEKKGLKQCAWANKHKISPAVISRYLNGNGMSAENAYRVEKATKGEVTADEILKLLQILNREHGKTIVMVTHDAQAAEFAQRTLHVDKGKLEARVAA